MAEKAIEETAVAQQHLSDTWWLVLLKGIALILFGLTALIYPGLSLAILVTIFAIYIFVDGIVNIVLGFAGIGKESWWILKIVLGFLEIIAGVYAIRHPLISTYLFVIIVASVFIARGIIEIISAFSNEYESKEKALLIVAGVLGILAGVIILGHPVSGGIAFVWVLGLYALIAGSVTIAFSFDLKKKGKTLNTSK